MTGNPREDLVVELFGRVTDIENFCAVLATLGLDTQLSAGRRIGWLNALNPHEIDRYGAGVSAVFVVRAATEAEPRRYACRD